MSTILTIRDNNDLAKLMQLFNAFKETGKGGDRKVRAFKYTNTGGIPPVFSHSKLRYHIGVTVEVKNASENESNGCARGVNVASFEWCVNDGGDGFTLPWWREVYLMEFTVKDIAAIPRCTWDKMCVRGKFRLFRGTVIARMTNDGKKRVREARPLVIKTRDDLAALRKLFLKFKKNGSGGDQRVHAFKYTDAGGIPPVGTYYYPILRYRVGEKVEVPKPNRTNDGCGAGVNVASREWVLAEASTYNNRLPNFREGYLMEFHVRDIASIPIFSGSKRPQGKFRLYRALTKKRLSPMLD